MLHLRSADPAWSLADRLLLLMAEGCPDCRDRIRTALTPSRLSTVVSTLVSTLDIDSRAATGTPQELVDEFLAHPHPHHALHASRQLDHEALARELIERSRHLLATDPGRAELATSLALTALDAAPRALSPNLRTAAAVHRAHAVRFFDPPRAGALLDSAEDRIAACSSPRLRGDLHLLAALIRQDLGLLKAASLHLRSALHAYKVADDRLRLARALLHAASFLRQTGNLADAISVASYASTLSDPDADRQTYLAVHHNLAAYLIDDAQYEAARDLLLRIVPLYPAGPESQVLLQYRWLCARLASATGDLRGAVGTYEDLRDRFTEAGRPREAALVVVDLARFYLDLNDLARSREALMSLIGLFDPDGLSPLREPLEDLLVEVAAGERPSRLLLHRLSTVLRRS